MVVSDQCASATVEISSDKESVLDTATNNVTANENETIEIKVTNNSDQGSKLNENMLMSSTERVNADIDVDENDDVTMDTVKHAPDGGWGWCIVLGALLLRTVIGGLGRSHGLFYIKFKERYGGSATGTALVTSLTGFIRLSAGPIVSILSGRFRCRVLTACGSLILFLGLIISAFAINLQFLYFSYGIITGIGRALALTPVPILLGYYFDKRRSLAFGLASAGFSLGGFTVTPVVEILFQHFGYQGTFLILSGFALNVLVSSSLFRPIELHRRLVSIEKKSDPRLENDANLALLPKTGDPDINITARTSGASKDDPETKPEDNTEGVLEREKHLKSTEMTETFETSIDVSDSDVQEDNSKTNESRQSANGKSQIDNIHDNRTKSRITNKNENKERKTLISWSILKDIRFLSFVFATFCFTLPTSGLFLPALAKSKGMSEIQAATLLSTASGFDTVFRVLSGIVLDFRMFRSIRPQIFNGITFIQGILPAIYPSMTTFTSFMVLTATEGAVQGIRNAQGSVIIMDMLGVDKLASSMAITMTIQCVAVFLGPTIAGQLTDTSGSYNGAFYFSSAAILLGALVMATGNIVKHYRDNQSSATSKNSSGKQISELENMKTN